MEVEYDMNEENARKKVREAYTRIAEEGFLCESSSSCCNRSDASEVSKKMGYTEEELESAPENANLGLGCGNPVALASLKEGEIVIDLGSGAGIDCFLAAKRVGENGRVIGVDMTPKMIDKARENARKGNYRNVEFRLGEIENLPIADNTADVVISNCVVNLSPNKKKVFEEAFRALKPGGRLMISDMVLLKELPDMVKERAHPASCVPGAMMKGKYLETLKDAGFQQIEIIKETQHTFKDLADDPNARVIARNPKQNTEEPKRLSELDEETKKIVGKTLDSIASISLQGIKPSK